MVSPFEIKFIWRHITANNHASHRSKGFRYWSYFTHWRCIFLRNFCHCISIQYRTCQFFSNHENHLILKSNLKFRKMLKYQQINRSWILSAIDHSVNYPPILIAMIQISPRYLYMWLWRYNASHFGAQSIVHALIMFAHRIKKKLFVKYSTLVIISPSFDEKFKTMDWWHFVAYFAFSRFRGNFVA
jgi:hypothetical protein